MESFSVPGKGVGSDHVLPRSVERVRRRSFMSDRLKMTTTVPFFDTQAAGWMCPLTLLAMRTGFGGQASSAALRRGRLWYSDMAAGRHAAHSSFGATTAIWPVSVM